MEKIKVGVVGATGYAGSEICRLIMGHPQAELAAISSVSFEGMALSQVYPAYYQMIDLVCGTQEEVVEESDVIFAALPHGLSQDLAAQCDALGKTFIDMGADFRLECLTCGHTVMLPRSEVERRLKTVVSAGSTNERSKS